MKVELRVSNGSLTVIDLPSIPRKGDVIQVSDMPYLYKEGSGESPLFNVDEVHYCLDDGKFDGVILYISNEED